MTKRRALWLVPLLLTVHNAEEALFIHRVLPLSAEHFPAPLRGWMPTVTPPQFLIALSVATVLPYVVALLCGREGERRRWVFLLVALQATMALNVLSHVGAAVMLGGYSPGLVTALAINVPFSVYLLHRAIRERWVASGWSLLAAAVVIHGPVLLGVMALAGWAA
ncbi:HXXEE domain-containing protein [Archangium gephyra]|nr:HXXEE domain-containing protein [Archangium gephyra]